MPNLVIEVSEPTLIPIVGRSSIRLFPLKVGVFELRIVQARSPLVTNLGDAAVAIKHHSELKWDDRIRYARWVHIGRGLFLCVVKIRPVKQWQAAEAPSWTTGFLMATDRLHQLGNVRALGWSETSCASSATGGSGP